MQRWVSCGGTVDAEMSHTEAQLCRDGSYGGSINSETGHRRHS